MKFCDNTQIEINTCRKQLYLDETHSVRILSYRFAFRHNQMVLAWFGNEIAISLLFYVL